MKSLSTLRKRIDRVDRELLSLLNQRARLALRVGKLKRANKVAVFDRRREQAVLRRIARANRGPLSRTAVQSVFREVLRASRRLER